MKILGLVALIYNAFTSVLFPYLLTVFLKGPFTVELLSPLVSRATLMINPQTPHTSLRVISIYQ